MSKSEIKLIGLQIKSLEKFKKLAQSLDTIEKECGIKEVKITLDDYFICPDIDFSFQGFTPMEEVLLEIIKDI